MAKLSAICEINMGQSPESSSYNEVRNGLPFFQGNADFGEIHPSVRVWCTEPKKIAKCNDILISVRAPIGALNIANIECCIGRGLAALTVNDKICSREFLWYALESNVDLLVSKGTGSTFKAIGKNVLYDLEIPLPPLETQKQIAKTLDKVTDLINKRKQQLEKLDELVKSRFVEMFFEKDYPILKWNDVFNTTTGKLDSNAMVENGQYTFFTCAKEIFRIDEYAFDQEALLLAGNNAAGKYDVKYFKGKFNAYQRTYVLGLKQNWSYQLFRYQLEDKLDYLQQQSLGGLTKYLTLKILGDLE
ncbi:MAG: restriction endonuclease subunit S, partial [Ruminiclostridium sp.]|nr:restriction endonuclease subunit S [Ruminiclostridium sp.]